MAAVNVRAARDAGAHVIDTLPDDASPVAQSRLLRSSEVLVRAFVPPSACETVRARLVGVDALHDASAGGPTDVDSLAELRPCVLDGLQTAWNATPVGSLAGERYVWVPGELGFVRGTAAMGPDEKVDALKAQLRGVCDQLAGDLPLSYIVLTYDVWLERHVVRELPRTVTVPALLLRCASGATYGDVCSLLGRVHAAKKRVGR